MSFFSGGQTETGHLQACLLDNIIVGMGSCTTSYHWNLLVRERQRSSLPHAAVYQFADVSTNCERLAVNTRAVDRTE
jgi:hypothetical protein